MAIKSSKDNIPPIERMGRSISGNVQRWFPDTFIFAIILVFIVFIVAGIVEHRSPYLLMQDMYQGFWSFLGFGMQMCLILVSGYALAYHPKVRNGLTWICKLPRDGKQAAALIAFLSCVFSWVHWGLGLILGAYIAREMGRQAYLRKIPVHYAVLCTAGYSGMGLIWHWGLSGSAPLLVNTSGHFLENIIGIVPVSRTIFSSYAIINSLIILVFAVVVFYLIHPGPKRCRGIEYYAPGLVENHLEEERTRKLVNPTIAERLENNRWIAIGMAVIMVGCMVYWFSTRGFMGGLDLNAVNFIFILVGLLIYMNPIAYVKAIGNASGAVGGILLQFPFYAGIQGVMMYSGLGATIANLIIKIATPFTFPALVWLVAGLASVITPSGGGEWMTIGEPISRAGIALGVPAGKFIIAYGAGDTWTNMFNPFWAIPLLAITQVKARDMFGFCIAVMILAIIPYFFGLTFVPY